MTLRRCTKSVDGTIPIPALLYNDEELLSSQGGVGIYDGAQKSPNHQSGTVHITTHRLFYISAHHRESAHSFVLDLSCISQTDYYAGLFKSSAKVTLHISVPSGDAGSTDGPETPFESWECGVCAYRNPPGLSPAAARICALCGIPRDSFPVAASPQQSSSSLPASTSLPSLLPPSTSTSSRSQPSAIACPACTFLNHPSLRECEICATELPQAAAPLSMKSAPSSRPASPDLSDDEEPSARLIKISFRKGGDKAFYGVLRRSLKSKAWTIGARSSSSATPGDTSGSGITSILRTVESSAQERATGMSVAFQDLEAFMVKAKDMVRLAADLNERLTASSAVAMEPEEATFIRSSLSQLGLQMADAPVTHDMAADEQRWIIQLARELAGVLQGTGAQGGLMRARGVVALDEVWGGWNRARGVALLPPTTLLQVAPHLAEHTDPPIALRAFPSGLRVLHTPRYAHAAFAARLAQSLIQQSQTVTEIARAEGVAVGLAAEMVGEVEDAGEVCRDDEASVVKGGGAEVRFWGNVFQGYVWDGQAKDDDGVY